MRFRSSPSQGKLAGNSSFRRSSFEGAEQGQHLVMKSSVFFATSHQAFKMIKKPDVPEGVFEFVGTSRAQLCHPCGEWDSIRLGEQVDSRLLGGEWQVPTMEIHNEDEGKRLTYSDAPDTNNSSYFMFRPSAIDALGEMLIENGELLPVDCPEEVYLYNVTNVVDALDTERTKFKRLDSGRIYMYDCPIFRQSMVCDQAVFRTPQEYKGIIFVTHRFVARWRAAKLKGLEFINTADMTPNWWSKGKIKKY
jgi:hypothetical protein